MTGAVGKLAGGRFLVVGRAGMDLYADPPGTPIETASRFTAALGGSSANIAVALRRHGLQATLLTRVSDDAVGCFCLARLAAYGVGTAGIVAQPGEARNSLAVVETRIENCQSVIYRNNAADFQMTRADVDAVDFSGFDALITTGTVLAAEPSRSATFHAFDRARAAGLPMIFDVDYRPYSWPSADEAAQVYSRAASYCDIIIGNDVEFGFMAGGYDRGLAKARDLARNEGRLVVYKMGEGGAITLQGSDEFRTGIYAVQALKPTGAGDAFMGGFVSALSKGAPLRDAVLAGSACAAIVVTRVGCAPAMPDPTELAAFLRQHPGPTLPTPL